MLARAAKASLLKPKRVTGKYGERGVGRVCKTLDLRRLESFRCAMNLIIEFSMIGSI